MTESIELDGVQYEMDGDPTLRTVRAVQGMQNELLLKYVDEDKMQNMDSLEDEGEIIDAILDSGGLDALEEVQWERSMLQPIQTISLACDEAFSTDDFESMTAREFKDIQSKAKDALNGSADDFFKELGIGMFFSEEQMNRQNV